MSENITIITVTDPDAPATKEPQIIGASSAERITAYKETERRIRETYAVAGDLVNEQTRIISDALNALYGMYDNRTDAVAGVVHSFNEPVLIKHMNNRDKALRQAREALTEDGDAVTTWLLSVGVEEFGGSYVNEFLSQLPATVEQLNTYADRQGLCTSYESAARRIHESVEGGYFTDTRTVTKRLRYWENVPEEFNGPGEGEDADGWEIVAVMPPFYRDKWVRASSTETIIKRAISFTYREIATTPDSNEG